MFPHGFWIRCFLSRIQDYIIPSGLFYSQANCLADFHLQILVTAFLNPASDYKDIRFCLISMQMYFTGFVWIFSNHRLINFLFKTHLIRKCNQKPKIWKMCWLQTFCFPRKQKWCILQTFLFSTSPLHLRFQMSLSNLAFLVATSQLSCPFYMGLCDGGKAGREGSTGWASASFVLVSKTPAPIGISPTDLPYMVRSPCPSTVTFYRD